jgi:hypothetical protein
MKSQSVLHQFMFLPMMGRVARTSRYIKSCINEGVNWKFNPAHAKGLR